jgi:hypothetical protein
MGGRLQREEGWAVVTAVMVLMLMMSFGLAAYAVVDTQTAESKKDRNREASFNLSEGALQEQAYVLGFNWPGAAPGYVDCSSGAGADSTPPGVCPQPANLVGGNFTQVDVAQGAIWKTSVRDNRISPGGAVQNSDFYDPTVETTACMGTNTAPCRWDANGDGKLWIRASATVRGKTRTLVALVKRERLTEDFPRVALKADHFSTSNNGNKVIIDSTGAQIVTRCQYVPSGRPCEDYNASKGQVAPAGSIVHEPPQTAPTMDDGQLARFKAAAESSTPRTYYDYCPPSLTGSVVYIDVPAGTTCSYSSNPVWNSATAPGLVIMPRGRMSLTGGATFYGVLYFANQDGYTGDVLDIGGNVEVVGGVVVDGGGGVTIGSSGAGGSNGPNLSFAANAFNPLATFGTAGLIQSTWRELPGNQS